MIQVTHALSLYLLAMAMSSHTWTYAISLGALFSTPGIANQCSPCVLPATGATQSELGSATLDFHICSHVTVLNRAAFPIPKDLEGEPSDLNTNIHPQKQERLRWVGVCRGSIVSSGKLHIGFPELPKGRGSRDLNCQWHPQKHRSTGKAQGHNIVTLAWKGTRGMDYQLRSWP